MSNLSKLSSKLKPAFKAVAQWGAFVTAYLPFASEGPTQAHFRAGMAFDYAEAWVGTKLHPAKPSPDAAQP